MQQPRPFSFRFLSTGDSSGDVFNVSNPRSSLCGRIVISDILSRSILLENIFIQLTNSLHIKKERTFICLHRFVEVSCSSKESMAAPMEFDEVYEEIRGVLVSRRISVSFNVC